MVCRMQPFVWNPATIAASRSTRILRIQTIRQGLATGGSAKCSPPFELGTPAGACETTAMPGQLEYHDVRKIFTRFRNAKPVPKGELDHVNAFTLLVAVVLSAQATDNGVNKATRDLFQRVKTPEAMLALGEAGLIDHIRTIGLYRQKAKNVITLSRILVEKFGGEVPSSRTALVGLPGVGRKTANVVLNICFGHPAQAVDTHIFRFGNRSGLAVGKDVTAVERAIEDHVPVEFQPHAHHWMILHGRYVCKARKPLCSDCLIADLCGYEEKTP